MLKIILLTLIALNMVAIVSGQVAKETKYVKMPATAVSVLIASQPDCPVKIEEATPYIALGPEIAKTEFISIKVKNGSNKNVRLIDFTHLAIGGTASDMFTNNSDSTVISPNGTLVYNTVPENNVIPLTDKLKEDLNWKDKYAVVILFVKEVRFDDGSVYSNSLFHKKLFDFVSDIEAPNS